MISIEKFGLNYPLSAIKIKLYPYEKNFALIV
jgi:hypothetical protein